eukprot:Hpha_TRINITY_DN18374_c0_g1::TRINITY_DN18374_c0_g1_i1::g.158205::m.158205/K03217/yidC, spoIIIJ, OXA1, ccfA; YidC/Oxa1 family membrane protein insertase
MKGGCVMMRFAAVPRHTFRAGVQRRYASGRFFEATDSALATASSAVDVVGWGAAGLHALNAAGLPWWSAAALCGAALRSAALPYVLQSLRNGARLRLYSARLVRLREELLRVDTSPELAGDERRRLVARAAVLKQIEQLKESGGFTEVRAFLGPVVALMPLALAHLSTWRAASSASGESLLWIADLAQSDPLLITPVAAGVLVAIAAEGTAAPGTLTGAPRAGLWAACALYAALLSQLPSLVGVAVVSSGVVGLVPAALLRSATY